MRRSVVAALLVCASCASTPARGAASRFVFQDSFWVNLHHSLRAEARRRERGAEPELSPAVLEAGEREAWTRALDAYRPFAQRSLLFDEELVRIHAALAAAPDEAPPPDALDAELRAALNAAAPVFRAHLWPARARANDEWIARTRPAVERLAQQVTDGLAAACRQAWPAQPILVDVTPDTGADLAYTTNVAPPGFAGLATLNPSVAGGSPAAIECVFHEAAHVIDSVFVRWVEEESARQRLEPPAELWHALLFYTSGELTRRALGTAGTFRADLAQGFAAELPALDAHWLPYLEGREPLAVALREVVRGADAERKRRAATQPAR